METHKIISYAFVPFCFSLHTSRQSSCLAFWSRSKKKTKQQQRLVCAVSSGLWEQVMESLFCCCCLWKIKLWRWGALPGNNPEGPIWHFLQQRCRAFTAPHQKNIAILRAWPEYSSGIGWDQTKSGTVAETQHFPFVETASQHQNNRLLQRKRWRRARLFGLEFHSSIRAALNAAHNR